MASRGDHAAVAVSQGRPLRGSSTPLHRAYDAALLDLDGVIYIGQHAVAGAARAVDRARTAGMRVAYVTNNASRTPAAVASQLRQLGLSAAASDVVTSAQAAARLVAERFPAGVAVLVVGGAGLRVAVREHGLLPVSSADDDPVAVIQGYTPSLNYALLAEGALAVARGALFVASNADTTLPTPRGLAPGNGALLQVIRTATGREPIVAGKPEPPLHREAVTRTQAQRPLVVGDRLDTDIESAVRSGADSLLVLSGVTGPADVVAAPPHRRPTYLAPDLSGLTAPHPDVRRTGSRWRCGAWTVLREGARLEVCGDGDPYDGLRALCAASWDSDPTLSESAIHRALAQLGWPGARPSTGHRHGR